MILPLAHGVEVRADLPIPPQYFAFGAAMVLIVSFAALAALWQRPLLEAEDPGRAVAPLPSAVDLVLGAIGLVVFGATVYAGLSGSDIPQQNFAPNLVYVLFWVGLVPVSLLFGDVFRLLSPWRSVARGVRWVAARATKDELPAPLAWPERAGRWPAVAGLLVFAWFELIATNGNDPRVVAILALLYMATMLVGMTLFGIEPWTRNADPFGVYFNLFSRMSPWARRAGRLVLRRPGAGLRRYAAPAGTVTLLCVAIGVTSFDGLTGGGLWKTIQFDTIPFFQSIGLPYVRATQATYLLALIVSIALIVVVYRLGVRGMRTVSGARPGLSLLVRFAHSLAPIAAAYVIAHYFSLLVFGGQTTVALGNDLLHGRTTTPSPDYAVLSAAGIWYVQVAALVIGHVSGLMLAHDRALAVYPNPKKATRSQMWMLLVMVAFTMLGLWLLSSAN